LERQAAFAKQEINRKEQSGRGAGFVPGHDQHFVNPVFETHGFILEASDVACNNHDWDRKQERVLSISGECQKALCEKWNFRKLEKTDRRGIARKYRKVSQWQGKKG